MKKIVLALALILVVMTGRSQSNEGVMHWTMKIDFADPKMKAQMEQMAKVMGNNAANGMMPTGLTVKMKGMNHLVSIEGGIMDRNDILILGDKSVTYTINHAQKTYMIASTKNDEAKHESPKITRTSETAKILNYTCTKYIIETPGPNGKTTTINYWATNEIKDIDLKALAKHQMGKIQSLIYTEIDGVPLKIEMTLPEGGMTMEATEFTKKSMPASDFELPAGYKEMKL